MEVIGILTEKHPPVTRGQYTFAEFVVETTDARNPNYKDYYLCQLSSRNLSIVDSFAVGAFIRVQCNLRGRKWIASDGATKYILSLDAWRVEPMGMPAYVQNNVAGYAQPQAQPVPTAPQPTAYINPQPVQQPAEAKLPF